MRSPLVAGIAALVVLGSAAATLSGGDDVADIPKLWLNRLAKGAANQYGSVEIVGDGLYATNTGGDVVKLRLKTGETIWKVKLPERIQMGLAATPYGLYVATTEGVFRLDPKDGKTVWGTDLGGPVSNVPAVDGEDVLAGTINEGQVALLRSEDGKVRWKRTIPRHLNYCCLAGRYALVATSDSPDAGLHLLDRENGDLLWNYRCKGISAAIGAGVVTFGDACLRLRDGKPVWVIPDPARYWAAGDGRVVGVFGKDRIAAFDAATGKKLWSRVVPGDPKKGIIPIRSGPALVGDRVVVALERGEVMVLDAASGHIAAAGRYDLHEHDDNGQFHGSPAVADGIAVVSTSGCKTLGVKLPFASGSWPGEHGGGARWGRAAGFDPGKLPGATAPKAMEATREARALEVARGVEEKNERADALAALARRFPESDDGKTAFELLHEIYEERLTELSLRHMPAGDWDLAFPDLEIEVREFVNAERPQEIVPGLGRLEPPEVADAIGSSFIGRRAWACERLGELSTSAAREALVWMAARDVSDLVRAVAVESLAGHAGPEDVRDALNRALQDESDNVRRAACVATPGILAPEEARRVLRYVEGRDADDLVREKAREVLDEME